MNIVKVGRPAHSRVFSSGRGAGVRPFTERRSDRRIWVLLRGPEAQMAMAVKGTAMEYKAADARIRAILAREWLPSILAGCDDATRMAAACATLVSLGFRRAEEVRNEKHEEAKRFGVRVF